jgi:hypothetical protein
MDGMIAYIKGEIIFWNSAIQIKQKEYNILKNTNNDTINIEKIINNYNKRLQYIKEKLKKIIIKYETEIKETKPEYDRCYHYDIDTIDVDKYILNLKNKIASAKELAKKYDIEIEEKIIEIREDKFIEIADIIQDEEMIIYI